MGDGQARGDAFEVKSAVPHGERNIRFFIAAGFLTAQKAGRLITALCRTQAQHGGQSFAPFLPPCGTEAVTVEAVRFVFFIAFLIDVETADPVLAGVSVIDDGIAQQAVVAVGTGAAGIFQTTHFNGAQGLQLRLPPAVDVQARTAGVGVRVVAVEAAFVERGQADVVALVGVACAYRKAGGHVVILGSFRINFAVIVRACRGVPAFGQRPFFLCAELVVDGGGVDRLGEGPVAVCAAAGSLVDVLFASNACRH